MSWTFLCLSSPPASPQDAYLYIHILLIVDKRRNNLTSSTKGTAQSQDPCFYLWLQNPDSSNFPFVNRSPKKVSLRAPRGWSSL